MVTSTVRRIYIATYNGLSNAAYDVQRRKVEGMALKRDYPEFAHIIHLAMKHAMSDYVTDAVEKKLAKCKTAAQVMAVQ